MRHRQLVARAHHRATPNRRRRPQLGNLLLHARSWREQASDGCRYRWGNWCDRQARAWYARAASDRVMSGPRLGSELSYQIQRWLARRLQSYTTPSARTNRARARAQHRAARAAAARRPPGPPAATRVFLMCGWAIALALLGLPVAGRALIGVLAGVRPDWLHPGTAMGVIGIALAVAAFIAIHHRRLPWILLTAATILLIVNPG